MGTNFANARYAVTHFLPEEQRDDARAEIAQTSWNLLTRADPGSDAPLTLARSTIATLTATPEESGTERLQEILTGPVTGLQLSPDLRLSIIRGVAARDALPLELLDQQRADDTTITADAEYLGAKHRSEERRVGKE